MEVGVKDVLDEIETKISISIDREELFKRLGIPKSIIHDKELVVYFEDEEVFRTTPLVEIEELLDELTKYVRGLEYDIEVISSVEKYDSWSVEIDEVWCYVFDGEKAIVRVRTDKWDAMFNKVDIKELHRDRVKRVINVLKALGVYEDYECREYKVTECEV
jgi:hypothetical protein